ncbi:putative quinol monooxygenase [Dyadobacter sp. OTU695]|uniref:putative quinol monooxygenase n=1 Tax=Dyadobacter sp. OTU695 TaxID=3043860 RepID=UPI00313E9F96
MHELIFITLCLLGTVAAPGLQSTREPALEANFSYDAPAVAKLTKFEVKKGHEQQFRNALVQNVRSAIAADGNIMAEAYQEQDNPSVLWLIERWTKPAEVEKFSKTSQARQLSALFGESLTAAPTTFALKDLEPITKQQWRAAAKREDRPITVMLFVDTKPATQQQFKDIYHVAMPQFRGEPGVITYQLSEIEGDGTHFVTYEKFRDEDAFKYHLDFPPVKPVIQYLESNVKQPPFQNGLHNLVEIAPLTRE